MQSMTLLAVALKCEENKDDAPTIVAGGRGEVAQRIIKTAEEEGVPIHHDEKLAEVLVSLEVGTLIPPELYEAVVQVIAFVWRLDGKNMETGGG
ncbi:MAG: EscU/YscU/HrcU family type III secretion system export apparatus switch protein [Syntrophomonadaceae bacterium]|jgi:flagellar biosynthesis protein